jgi:NAD(P)-dependent dehydrogenase (short-subunit alcohol dehydrogenase family)
MRMKDKKVIVVGAGQSPGEGIGNGRAAAILMAREGAEILSVDRDLKAAEETAALIRREEGTVRAHQADVTREADMKAMVEEAGKWWGRIDVLHYNVGVSLAGGDKGPLEITESAFDNVNAINLRGFVMAVKHTLPVMRAQRSGVILCISSVAALSASYLNVAYKTSKAGMIAFTEQIARQNA